MRQIGLDSSFFKPQSVAVVGASEGKGRIGSGLYKSITENFEGRVYCVNPRYDTLWGKACYASVLELPEKVSHVVIAVTRELVLGYVRQCVKAEITNVVVVSSGFKECDAEGAAIEKELAVLCRENGIRLLGPNTLGFINTEVSFNGTFLPDQIMPGHISVISQSGGVGMALLAAIKDQHCGIAKWIGIGNEAVLDAAACLEYLAQDSETKVIAICFEGVQHLYSLLKIAFKVNLHKPIVILRDGRSRAGMQAAISHTGTMAQDDSVISGLLSQAGLLEAGSCRQCAVMLKALSLAGTPGGKRVAVLANTAGPSIMAVDVLESAGVCFPQPTKKLQIKMDAEAGISMGLNNPADISSNGLSPDKYGIVAKNLLASQEYDSLLAIYSLNRHLILPDHELTAAVQETGKPAVACFLGSNEEFACYDRMPEANGVPCYCTPQDAADAMGAIIHYSENIRKSHTKELEILTEKQREEIQKYLRVKSMGDTRVLPEREARKLLKLAGIGTSIPLPAASVQEAITAAVRCGYPVVLKVYSEKIIHKSDVGGVSLNLKCDEEVECAAKEMLEKMRKLDPRAILTVQRMMPEGLDMILGAVRLPEVGPLVMIGMGGIYSELYRDVAFRLVPMCAEDPERMLECLRIAPALDGYRGKKLDKNSAIDLIKKLGALMEAVPQIQEVDINPCRIYENSAVVLDARVTLKL